MRTKTAILFLFLISLIVSCSGLTEKKQQKELEKLAKEVMDIHDRTMADYGKLYSLKKKLLKIYEIEPDSNRKNEINALIFNLEKADIGMMDWMHQYHEPEDYLPFDEKKSYYIEQRSFISEVEKRTRLSIDNAKNMIEKYPELK